jgi:hypothetical protein
MICRACISGVHLKCLGSDQCPCQHRIIEDPAQWFYSDLPQLAVEESVETQ